MIFAQVTKCMQQLFRNYSACYNQKRTKLCIFRSFTGITSYLSCVPSNLCIINLHTQVRNVANCFYKWHIIIFSSYQELFITTLYGEDTICNVYLLNISVPLLMHNNGAIFKRKNLFGIFYILKFHYIYIYIYIAAHVSIMAKQLFISYRMNI